MFKKVFRIVKFSNSRNAYHYRIEVRHTILLVLHWWSTPEFEPPHLFYTSKAAAQAIKEHYPNAVIYLKLQ